MSSGPPLAQQCKAHGSESSKVGESEDARRILTEYEATLETFTLNDDLRVYPCRNKE